MDIKFSKDSGDSQPQDVPGEKKRQSALLVLLLILVGGFTYVYFFTSLIKPQEAQKVAEPPAPAPQIVKMPLPPREGEPDKPAGQVPEKAEAPKTAVTVPVTAAVPAAKPAAAPTKSAPTPSAKPTPAPSKTIEEPKKTEAAKPADNKPQQVSVMDKNGDKAAATKGAEKKTAADAKKPAVADKKGGSGKDGIKKPVSGDQTKPVTVVKAKKTAPGSWSLIVGNYVLEEALSADMGRVRKSGFEPIVKPATRKRTAMNRLFVSEFNDRATAQSTLEKLKPLTSDAFVIEQGGRFAVYAGSYLQNESANIEKERLKAAGFTVTVKHTDIAIPSQSLSVGPFKSKKAADAALGKLNSAGLKATCSQK
ncbi:MAG TPA: SPOR domain-containing protein [Desulfuromonadaceae bacterium]